jgi:phosphoribosylaminoimidazolecarboxamide formyltransferase/IMP cyclohydrolase
MKIKTALISVTHKDGLLEFARGLASMGVRLIATSGTASYLASNGVKAEPLAEAIGSSEMMDGRVKTLHPKVFAGILALRSNPRHLEEARAAGVALIDLVVVNLYDFESVLSKKNYTLEEALENIDIGGVSLIRAAAKNFKDVVLLTDPADYTAVLNEMRSSDGSVSEAVSRELATKGFKQTSAYDQAIARALDRPAEFPKAWNLMVLKVADLRYGENPHQRAALYRFGHMTAPSVTNATQLGGKDLSYNNILDTDAAQELVLEFAEPACVIVKHTNPCGAAEVESLSDAFQKALKADPKSAYGGILALNGKVTASLAEQIARKENFFEVIIAPDYEEAALSALKGKVKWGASLRILQANFTDRKGGWQFRSVRDGLLVQSADEEKFAEFSPVVGKPTEAETEDLKFAWIVAKHTKSNAIVVAKDGATLGIGQGQTSRVDACALAIRKAAGRAKGAVAASDAFFPFPDGVEMLIEAGVTAIVHPGGSIRDEEVHETARSKGCKIVLTRMRHFKH